MTPAESLSKLLYENVFPNAKSSDANKYRWERLYNLDFSDNLEINLPSLR